MNVEWGTWGLKVRMNAAAQKSKPKIHQFLLNLVLTTEQKTKFCYIAFCHQARSGTHKTCLFTRLNWSYSYRKQNVFVWNVVVLHPAIRPPKPSCPFIMASLYSSVVIHVACTLLCMLLFIAVPCIITRNNCSYLWQWHINYVFIKFLCSRVKSGSMWLTAKGKNNSL